MIVCGWCGNTTEPEQCSTCAREPSLPWAQRGLKAPNAAFHTAGRPRLEAGQIRAKLRIAHKELPDATSAELAEHLGIDVRTLGRWRKMSGLRAISAAPDGGR